QVRHHYGGHECRWNQGDPVGLPFPNQVGRDGPQDNGSQRLIRPGKVSPYDGKVDTGEHEPYQKQGSAEEQAVLNRTLTQPDKIGNDKSSTCKRRIARRDGRGNNDTQFQEAANGSMQGIAYFVDYDTCVALVVKHGLIQRTHTSLESPSDGLPYHLDYPLSYHGAIEDRP